MEGEAAEEDGSVFDGGRVMYSTSSNVKYRPLADVICLACVRRDINLLRKFVIYRLSADVIVCVTRGNEISPRGRTALGRNDIVGR